MKRTFLTAVLLAICGTCFSQLYQVNYVEFNYVDDCGQTTTDYSHVVDEEITQIDNNTFSYSFEVDTQATEDGNECSYSYINSEQVSATEAFCNIFPFDTSGCCEDEYGFFRITPSNFQLLTPDPGINNERDVITLEAKPGYHSLVYNWQYFHPNTNQWVQFPDQFLGQDTIAFSAIDLFGDNASDFIGVSIQYKIELCNGWSPMPDPYTYVFINSSPQLIDLTPISTSCQTAEDGSFIMTVDRDLEVGEKLVVSVYSVNDEDEIMEQDYTTALIDNGDDTYSFTFPNILPQGNYFIKYQTQPDMEDPNNLQWNSLESSEPFQIEPPEVVTFSLSTINDVLCYGGEDGRILIEAQGGFNQDYEFRLFDGEWSNWTAFSNPNNHTVTDLITGDYEVEVRHASGCPGFPEGNNQITIAEPPEPVSIALFEFEEPAGNGFTNGSISMLVEGGTSPFTYEWLDQNDNVINTTQTEVTPDGEKITVHSIPAGLYTLVVRDANYDAATQKEGCTHLEVFELSEPPPLELAVEQLLPISCNSANDFNNPSNDGQLLATASGGVPFDPLLDGQYAYIYSWKKKDDQNNWQPIPNVSGNVLQNVDAGEYAVNIEDANGIIIGTYVDNVLQEAQDVTYFAEEPELLTVQLEKTDVSCFNGTDGTASVTISGGTAPYEIFWSMGATTEQVENLMAGTYMVYVMDAFGCEANGQVTIEQAGGLDIQIIEQTNPTCNEGSDGSISVEVSGGTGPYTYLWNNGVTSPVLSNVAGGIYVLEVTDAEDCIAFLEAELQLPLPVPINLGDDRTLCDGQSHELDITIDDPDATYLWTSDHGFQSASPKITITEAGTYTATVTTGLGCSGSDAVTVTTSNLTVDSQFLITSQAFAEEELVLVNTSDSLGTSTDWIFPDEAHVIEQGMATSIIRFDEPGIYEVTLRSYLDQCYQDFNKSIVVSEARQLPDVGDAESPFIADFVVYPNPSSGTFTVEVSLGEPAEISLRLFGLNSNVPHDDRQFSGNSLYEIPYSVNLPSGIYFLLLETPKENQIRKIVVQ